MKLAVKDMTTKHQEIKEFMMKVEASSDYFIHKIAEGLNSYILEFIRNAKYSKALAHSDEIEFDKAMPFLKAYANNNISSPTKKYLISKSNKTNQNEDEE